MKKPTTSTSTLGRRATATATSMVASLNTIAQWVGWFVIAMKLLPVLGQGINGLHTAGQVVGGIGN